MTPGVLALIFALSPAARAGSFHVGLANAVAAEGAKVLNKAVNSLPSCGGSFTLFTQAPISGPGLVAIEPLGHLFPPGHTIPSDHLYFDFNESTTAELGTTLYAPANGWIVQITKADYSSGDPLPGQSTDYDIAFSPCQEVALHFGHVINLGPGISDNGPTTCNSFSEGSGNAENGSSCVTTLQIPVKAGQVIGTGLASDFGPLEDTRVQISGFADTFDRDLSRGFCPMNYFVPSVQAAYTALLGQYNNGVLTPRTIAPVCGTIMQDVSGTAQGDWVFPGNDVNSLNDLALIHDNVFPSTAVFSVGQAMPASFQGTDYFFPKTTIDGTRIDYDFNLVADSQLYCYDTFWQFPQASSGLNPNLTGHIALIQLQPGLTSLKIEVQDPGTSCAAVGAANWAFTGASVTFQR